jgi:hypothetical protein
MPSALLLHQPGTDGQKSTQGSYPAIDTTQTPSALSALFKRGYSPTVWELWLGVVCEHSYEIYEDK